MEKIMNWWKTRFHNKSTNSYSPMDQSLTNLLQCPSVDVYSDPKKKHRAFQLVLANTQPTFDGNVMKQKKNESTNTVLVYEGKFVNKSHFKLVIPSTSILSAATKTFGIKHIISVYVGDALEREHVGNFYI